MTYRVTQSTGGSLSGYVNWTLSSFPIADYNLTGTVPSDVPTNLTYCRYRDFRESTGPSYTETSMFWNVTAARLAFVVVFEHLIFFVIYLLQWAVPNVPRSVQEKIDHERYIDQQERWTSKSEPINVEDASLVVGAVLRMEKSPSFQRRAPSKETAIMKTPVKTSAARRRKVIVRRVLGH